jgi:hypothetical protein
MIFARAHFLNVHWLERRKLVFRSQSHSEPPGASVNHANSSAVRRYFLVSVSIVWREFVKAILST